MKAPLLSVVRDVMMGAGFGAAAVDGGVMTRVTGWPVAALVSNLTKLPEMVVPSPARSVSGMMMEMVVFVLLVGI